MWEAIGQGICIMGIAASKSSVALFLLRIVLNAWHKAILWFCIISTTILCIITTTLLYAQCRPTAFLWNHTIPGGYCWLDFTKVGLTMGGGFKIPVCRSNIDRILCSLVRHHGLYPCHFALVCHMGLEHEAQREVYRLLCTVSWNIVLCHLQSYINPRC